MKLAIVSDIHANIEALQAVLAHGDAQGAARILCLGDIVGYNTDPGECVQLLRARGAVCIAGNHDRAVTGHISTAGFNNTAAQAVDWTRDHIDKDALEFLAGLPVKAAFEDTLVMVHGALHPERNSESVYLDTEEKRALSFAALRAHPSGARICAFGHTHRAGIFELRDGHILMLAGDTAELRPDAYYLINPGTVGQPRIADQRATYFILDTDTAALALHRVDYDASVPREDTPRRPRPAVRLPARRHAGHATRRPAHRRPV
jgi:predicted phosphodiesterase